MFNARFVPVLACGPVCRGSQPAEFRQTIRSRLPRNAGLGQDTARAAAAEFGCGKNEREIRRSIFAADRPRASGRMSEIFVIPSEVFVIPSEVEESETLIPNPGHILNLTLGIE